MRSSSCRVRLVGLQLRSRSCFFSEPYQRGSRNGSLSESVGKCALWSTWAGGGGCWFLQLPRSSTGSSPPVASPAPSRVHRGTAVARAGEEGHDGCAAVAGGERGRWMGAGDAMDGKPARAREEELVGGRSIRVAGARSGQQELDPGDAMWRRQAEVVGGGVAWRSLAEEAWAVSGRCGCAAHRGPGRRRPIASAWGAEAGGGRGGVRRRARGNPVADLQGRREGVHRAAWRR
jgi:hypothetical protein